jgi:hypothetical protein
MPEIGATLREARMRARIDMSEIEAQTKIRAKYLRALENEEWDLLPGPTFVKSFLRTYAQALGMDAKALVDEYKRQWEVPTDLERAELAGGPVVTSPRRRRPRPLETPPSRGYAIAFGAVLLVIVLLIVGLLSKGSTPRKRTAASTQSTHISRSRTSAHGVAGAALMGTQDGQVAVSIQPTAAVWVCLVDDRQRKLIPGVTLQPGETRGVYHARRFDLLLGNASVKLYVDGTSRTIPPSSRAIGYAITSGGRHTLAPAEQPTCT